MSRSAGPGSPVWFMCPVERRDRNIAHSYAKRGQYYGIPQHNIRLTGQTRQLKPGARRGLRSTGVSREYDCSCGHHGWSNHVDLERMEKHE